MATGVRLVAQLAYVLHIVPIAAHRTSVRQVADALDDGRRTWSGEAASLTVSLLVVVAVSRLQWHRIDWLVEELLVLEVASTESQSEFGIVLVGVRHKAFKVFKVSQYGG